MHHYQEDVVFDRERTVSAALFLSRIQTFYPGIDVGALDFSYDPCLNCHIPLFEKHLPNKDGHVYAHVCVFGCCESWQLCFGHQRKGASPLSDVVCFIEFLTTTCPFLFSFLARTPSQSQADHWQVKKEKSIRDWGFREGSSCTCLAHSFPPPTSYCVMLNAAREGLCKGVQPWLNPVVQMAKSLALAVETTPSIASLLERCLPVADLAMVDLVSCICEKNTDLIRTLVNEV